MLRKQNEIHLDRGAVAVEMALVLPLLILMVMGIIDFGRIFNGEIQLSQAAREGARIAALGASGYDTLDVRTRATAALTNPALQGTPSLAEFAACASPTSPCISFAVVAADGGDIGGAGRICAADDATDNYGQVAVTIPYHKILFGPTSLSQKAVMKCAG